MKKLLFLPLLALAFGCSPKVAPVVDADGTDWNAAAEQYRQNPAALKAMVEECDTKDQTVAQLRRELNDARVAGDNLGAAQQSATAAQQEITQLRAQLQAMQNAKQDEVITDQAMVQGVIFQVQLGAYAQNKVDPNLATGDALDLTEQNGLQKVVVSQFRTYSNASALRDRLKQMGVNGAFVVAKNNGQRIDVQEALRMTGQR